MSAARQLKFRVWDGSAYHYPPLGPVRAVAEYYEPWVLTLDGLIFQNRGEGRFGHDMWHRCTVEQWTGLTDSTGKEIYENDVIELADPYGRRLVGSIGWGAYWDEEYVTGLECWVVLGKDIQNPLPLSTISFGGVLYGRGQDTDSKPPTVIGNVHQHPELLT